MFIFDEVYEGRKLYRKKITTIFRAMDKGILIAKYLFATGFSRHEVESILYSKMKLSYLRVVEETALRKSIKYMIKVAEQNPPEINTVSFNQAEIDFIKQQDEEIIRLILTAMMFAYKYSGGEFTASQMDIQRMINSKIKTEVFNEIFPRFMDMGFFNSYVKSKRKFNRTRYEIYYKPSEELLLYTRMGEAVETISDFKIPWVRIRKLLGYDLKYYVCCDCGCLDVRKTLSKTRCDECTAHQRAIMQENWRIKTNWVHPNRKESGSDFYYYYYKKEDKNGD